MSNKFPIFAQLVNKGFQQLMELDADRLFAIDLEPDAVYAAYLAAFPEGENLLVKERTEHDCGTCKHFIRRAGGILGIDAHNNRVSIWDIAATDAPAPYNTVAMALADKVREGNIEGLFRVGKSESSFGSKQTRSMPKGTTRVVLWDHLYSGSIPQGLRAALPDAVRGTHRTTVEVFERGLKELTPEAVQTVLTLIDTPDGLYRGAEFKPALVAFQKAQTQYRNASGPARQVFLWTQSYGPASRFRNTAMGTLVTDLSEGKDLEAAVGAFERMLAPSNYKRTTALVTPGMVTKAMETIQELGLEPALERRFARIEDIAVKDVLWVDGGVKPLMKGGIGEALMQHVAKSQRADATDEKRAEEITVGDFIRTVLPETTGMELLFTGRHTGNLVSLTAPIHPEPKQLFKWDNDFAWAYSGNVADSIKARVKAAGGKVDGVLRVSLSWFNHDDLDLHIHQPPTKGMNALTSLIFFQNRRGWTGGELDVDMNAGHGTTRKPVENITWPKTPPDGVYRVQVNNYAMREQSNVGFVVEVECGGKVTHYSYNKAVRDRSTIEVCTLTMKGGALVSVTADDSGVTASNISQEMWGITTEQYVPVKCVTLSPNYWGNPQEHEMRGNKHTFFMLEGCKNEEAARGIFNEFLHPRLEQHRKVFELIGEKTKCDPSSAGSQLSGLGFSSTKSDSVTVKVLQGKKQRLFNVKIGA